MITITYKGSDTESPKIIKKQKSFYLEKSVYATCAFHPSILPVQINLPMVYPPREWTYKCPSEKIWLNISDLDGGYLTEGSNDPYRLLSTLNEKNFFIYFGKNKVKKSHDKASHLCKIMNQLQKQAFQINKDFLKKITTNMHFYVELGLLMPYYLNNLHIHDGVTSLLREYYLKNPEVQKICSYNKLLQVLSTNIQRARYERTILNLANAYAGYHFYLPAFLDFRGRIYRNSILHFHERDLARSLIQIVDESNQNIIVDKSNQNIIKEKLKENIYILGACTSFHYKKFSTNDKAYIWLLDIIEKYQEENRLTCIEDYTPLYKELAHKALEARNPFQFLSLLEGIFHCILHARKNRIAEAFSNVNLYPITQDASASAYQIMSYFMLDERIAERTNLFPSKDGQIQDIYSFFRVELLVFLKEKLDAQIYTSIHKEFTRKLVKSIFMPLIYGKTEMSTHKDLFSVLSQYVTHKECHNITRSCFEFWSTKYKDMDSLIRLIRIIGWFASSSDRAVLYQTDYFITSQDYRVMEPHSIWVYDKKNKKRRKVTLRLSSDTRDRKKTEVSTFVNFIHQKDAYIAMNVVMRGMMNKQMEEPSSSLLIYTVHDNFITNASNSSCLPTIYLETFRSLGPPLSIINAFLIQNLFIPVLPFIQNRTCYDEHPASYQNMVIPDSKIDYFLNVHIPDHLKNDKRRLQVWKKNVSRLKTYYHAYTKKVTGGGDPINKVGRPSKKVAEFPNSAGRKIQHTFMKKNMNNTYQMMRSYSTSRNEKEEPKTLLMELYRVMKKKSPKKKAYPGLILATNEFEKPYPLICQTLLLTLSTMDLLIQYAYPCVCSYSKFTILLTMKKEHWNNVTFTIGNAIPLTYVPKMEVLENIYANILKYSELYTGEPVRKITLRIYSVGDTKEMPTMSVDSRISKFYEFLPDSFSSNPSLKNLTAKNIINRANKKYPANHITSV